MNRSLFALLLFGCTADLTSEASTDLAAITGEASRPGDAVRDASLMSMEGGGPDGGADGGTATDVERLSDEILQPAVDAASPVVDAASPADAALPPPPLPICGVAGGNTCTDATTTLCEGLPSLASIDCAVCCARRPLPSAAPNSYHIIVRADADRWDGAAALMDRGVVLCSDNRPGRDGSPPGFDLPANQWCRRLSSDRLSADELVATIHAAFQLDEDQPGRVMIDELEVMHIDKLAAVALTMRTRYPQYAGLWGVFVENTGSGDPTRYYGPKQPAIDELLQANAILAPEMYMGRGAYCNAGVGYGARDVWLAEWFRGDLGDFKKLHWLMQRRAELGSGSNISILFGVTDGVVGDADAYIFIDRLFYVWATRSGYPEVIDASNGGVGAYKWEASAVGSPNRDNLFADSFNHYCFGGRDSRYPDPSFCD